MKAPSIVSSQSYSTNAECFSTIYRECFIEAYPDLSGENRDRLLQKAVNSFLSAPRTVIIDTAGFKLAAKRLGIKNTYKAWETFLAATPDRIVIDRASLDAAASAGGAQ